MRVKGPEYSGNIVKCCVALHNICGDFDLNDDFELNPDEFAPQEQEPIEDAIENQDRRQRLLEQFIH